VVHDQVKWGNTRNRYLQQTVRLPIGAVGVTIDCIEQMLEHCHVGFNKANDGL
jgi:hypothetical protein